MEHLEDEDIARMIDGKISKRERECFLEHLSGCDMCLTIYNESLKFVEQENKKKFFLKMPNLGEIGDRFWQPFKSIFANKRLIPVYAVLLIGVILLPFLLLKENAQVKYIEESITAMESRGVHSFTGSNNSIYAAVRAGIFKEELSLLVDYSGKKELKEKLAARLINELKVIFKAEADSLLPDLVYLEEGTFESVVQRIRDMLKQRSLGEPFQFGGFVEQSILGTFENNVPRLGEVERYRHLIVQEYKDKLPEGVLKELNKFTGITGTVGLKESKDIFRDIKEIFISAE
ncbi:MAG TPA: hypothetical protein VK186_22330 [Candidatus Deferrimicrobium sp.]|nr:hypothetical protein [Candidatus Deferrimicrobium sp.]